MDCATRCKNCRICAQAKSDGKVPQNHDCRKNHAGSSKSMESLVQFCAAYVSQMDRKSHTAKLRKEKKEAKYPRNQLRRQTIQSKGKHTRVTFRHIF